MSQSDSHLFLSESDLRVLTGSPQRKRQIQWLRDNNIDFYLNLRNVPVVSVTSISQPWSASVASKAPVAPAGWMPRAAMRLVRDVAADAT